MPLPNLAALHVNALSAVPATTSTQDILDAIYTSINQLTTIGTYNDGQAVPAASKWVVARFQNVGVTEAVYCQPAASSPIAGRCVLIWAGAAAGGASVMASPDTFLAANIMFGAYVANTGSTVSNANYNAWNNATPFSGGTGRFTGYTKTENAALITGINVFSSSDYIALSQRIAAGTGYLSGGGFGIEAPSDSAIESEANYPGAVFDFFTTGSSGTASSTAWNDTAVARGLLLAGASNGNAHCYYLVPGSSSIRAMSYRHISTGGALNDGANTNCIGLAGSVQPNVLAFRDLSGGGTDGSIIGRHRALLYGPRAINGTYLADSGTKKFIALGVNSNTANDAALMPY